MQVKKQRLRKTLDFVHTASGGQRPDLRSPASDAGLSCPVVYVSLRATSWFLLVTHLLILTRDDRLYLLVIDFYKVYFHISIKCKKRRFHSFIFHWCVPTTSSWSGFFCLLFILIPYIQFYKLVLRGNFVPCMVVYSCNPAIERQRQEDI